MSVNWSHFHFDSDGGPNKVWFSIRINGIQEINTDAMVSECLFLCVREGEGGGVIKLLGVGRNGDQQRGPSVEWRLEELRYQV